MYNKIIIALGTLVIIASVSIFGYSVYKDKQVIKMHTDAISKITSSVDLKDYRKKQKKKINLIIEKVSNEISKTDDAEEINKLVANAKRRISKIKTDKELTTAEKKAARKNKAVAERQAADNQAAANNDPQQNYSYNSTPSYSEPASGNSGGSNSGGCVGNDAANFY